MFDLCIDIFGRIYNTMILDEPYVTKRIYDGVEAKTRKYQASFQIIQVSSEALPRTRLE